MTVRVRVLHLGTVKQEALRIEGAVESPGGAALAVWEVRENGALETVPGLSPGRAVAAHCSSGCESHGVPQSLEARLWGGMEGGKGQAGSWEAERAARGPLS